MKKNRNIFFLCVMAGTMVFAAAGCNEDAEYEAIEFNVTGMAIEKSGNNDITFSSEIGSEGATVIFEATGKNAAYGFVREINCSEGTDGHYSRTADDDLKECPFVFYENSIFRVDILSDSPHTTQLTVQANESREQRQFFLSFGGGYTISDVYITQAGCE